MNNVTWSFASDAWGGGNIVDYVREANWNLGFSRPHDALAESAQLTLTLNNADGRFSPENSTSPYYPDFTFDKSVLVSATYSSTNYTMFRGWVDAIHPEPGQYGPRTTRVTINGFLSRTQDAEVFIPLMRTTTADLVIAEIIDRSNIFPPKPLNSWFLGRGLLGTDTYLITGSSAWLTADTGVSTMDVVGDNWQDGTSVYRALSDVVQREAGRLHINRDGMIVFWNRNHLLLNTTVQAGFDNSMVAMDYRYGDLFINQVTVTARPRKIGSSPEALGVLNKSTKIPVAESKTISFRYEDNTSGNRIAGQNAITPINGSDYYANTLEDGGGTDVTVNVPATLVNESATRAKIKFTNNAGLDVWILDGAQVRGTKITDYGQMDVFREDQINVGGYGQKIYKHPGEMDDVTEAENLAEFILIERRGPRGRIDNMTMVAGNAANITQMLTRTVGDLVTVKEEQTAINARYFIIGERHRLVSGDWRVTWILEPASVNTFWKLNDNSNLGTDTILA